MSSPRPGLTKLRHPYLLPCPGTDARLGFQGLGFGFNIRCSFNPAWTPLLDFPCPGCGSPFCTKATRSWFWSGCFGFGLLPGFGLLQGFGFLALRLLLGIFETCSRKALPLLVEPAEVFRFRVWRTWTCLVSNWAR